MMSIWWRKPIVVETRKVGQRVVITSVERAAEYLLHEWPSVEDGPAFNTCRQALIRAYDGEIDAEGARGAFIAALQESNIYIFPVQDD